MSSTRTSTPSTMRWREIWGEMGRDGERWGEMGRDGEIGSTMRFGTVG